MYEKVQGNWLEVDDCLSDCLGLWRYFGVYGNALVAEDHIHS